MIPTAPRIGIGIGLVLLGSAGLFLQAVLSIETPEPPVPILLLATGLILLMFSKSPSSFSGSRTLFLMLPVLFGTAFILLLPITPYSWLFVAVLILISLEMTQR